MRQITNSPEETIAFAKQIGAKLHAGDCIAYFGGLGMGKTTFTRGLAMGLGLEDVVCSPTFAIVNEYHGAAGACSCIILICTGFYARRNWNPLDFMIIRWKKMYLPLSGPSILQMCCRRIPFAL